VIEKGGEEGGGEDKMCTFIMSFFQVRVPRMTTSKTESADHSLICEDSNCLLKNSNT
jgi:hypothetical protein